MIETLGAPPPPLRRRRRPGRPQDSAETTRLPLTRVTSVRAAESFADESAAMAWLDGVVAEEATIDAVLDEGIALLNRALHIHSAAAGVPPAAQLSAERAASVRIGFGRGEEVAGGEFSAARKVDARAGGSPRSRRTADLRPQERLAAVLGGRERLAACETLIPRARADLDAGRSREAALQLQVGLEALLAELPSALDDPGHESDIAALRERRHQAGEIANLALTGNLDSDSVAALGELLDTCERVLRRRRILGE